jgi:hypothetical protein
MGQMEGVSKLRAGRNTLLSASITCTLGMSFRRPELVRNPSCRGTKDALLSRKKPPAYYTIVATVQELMSSCPNCGAYTHRVRRNLFERLVFVSIHGCSECDIRVRRSRWSAPALHFAFSTSTSCPRCETLQVHPASEREPLNKLSKHPLSLLQQIFRAPRRRCSFCRLEYHDFRPASETKEVEIRVHRFRNLKPQEEKQISSVMEAGVSVRAKNLVQTAGPMQENHRNGTLRL